MLRFSLRTLIVVMILAPPVCAVLFGWIPQRRAGHWVNSDGSPADPARCHQYDRYYFGYLPTYRWVGDIGEEEREVGVRGFVTLPPDIEPLEVAGRRWVIDWLWVFIQLALLGGLLSLIHRGVRTRHVKVNPTK